MPKGTQLLEICMQTLAKNQENRTAMVLICKFYNDSHCNRQDSHFTKGVWYLHIGSKCRCNHKAKKCSGLNTHVSKN